LSYLKKKYQLTGKEMLRRIFGPKKEEVTEECRRLHNEELIDLYCSPNIIRAIKSKERNGRGM